MTLRILTRLMLAVVVLVADRRLAAVQAYDALPLDAGHAAPEPPAAPAAITDPSVQPASAVAMPGAIGHDPWYGGVEFGITRFVHANGIFALTDDEVGASFRPFLGYENPRGLGMRGDLYFAGAESVATLAADASRFDLDPDAFSLNIDLYRRLRLDDFDLLLGAGSRIAAFGFDYGDGREDRWSGAGPSLFAEGRQLYYATPCSEWSVIGGGRLAYLVGEADYVGIDGYDDVGTTMTTGMAYLGFEYRREWSRGDFLFQFKGETQVWRVEGSLKLGLDTTGFLVGANW